MNNINVLQRTLVKRGQRSRLPREVLEVLQRNGYVDRFMEDGNGSRRVWFEKGVLIKPIRKSEIPLEALWAGKRDAKPIEYILYTSEGFKTDREARQLGIGGVTRFKVVGGCERAYIS